MKEGRKGVIKAILIFVVTCILLSSGTIADIVFKQGTDANGDSWDGPIDVIYNSNNKVWEVSEANLLLAIADAQPGGIVYLPICSITLTADLELNDTLLFGVDSGDLRYWGNPYSNEMMSELRMSSDVSIIMTNCSKLQNVFINCEVNHDYDDTAVHIIAHNEHWWHQNDVLKNVIIYNYWDSPIHGVGVNISSIHDGGVASGSPNYGAAHLSLCSFNDVQVRGFKYGLVLYANEAASTYTTGYTNGNMFNNWAFSRCQYFITLMDDSNAEVAGNTFSNIQIQEEGTGVPAGWGINISGNFNIFNNVFCWDWATGDDGYALILDGVSDTYAMGYFAGSTNISGSDYYVMDTSTGDAITD